MCTNRLYLRSNKLEFNSVVDRFYNYVPCGKCDECLSTKANDIVTRLLYHFDEHLHNGSIYYFTLTYDEINLPHYKGLACFDKSHVQKFIDNFRHKFSDDCFSYFLVSEYGHKHLRPHYHCLLFFKRVFAPQDVHFLVRKFWKYGNIDWSLNNGLVSSVKPMIYVSKYINKDVFFTRSLVNSKIITEEFCYLFRSDKELRKTTCEILPFHLHSNKLGYYMLSCLKPSDFVNGFTYRNDSEGLARKVMIPSSIMRKALKITYINKNGNVSYMYSSFGLSVLRNRLLKQYGLLEHDYLHLFDYSLTNFFNINFLKKRFAYDDYKIFVSNFINDGGVKRLVEYSLLYNGLAIQPTNFVDDLDLYLSCYFNGSSLDCFLDVDKSLLSMLNLLSQIRAHENFDKYRIRQQNYNTKQLLLSCKTGKYKPVLIKNFFEYNNINFNNTCLILLTKRINVV